MAERYEIHLKGHLDAAWFEDMKLEHTEDGKTVLQCKLSDQSALHSLLARIRDLGVPILMVALRPPEAPDTSADSPSKRSTKP